MSTEDHDPPEPNDPDQQDESPSGSRRLLVVGLVIAGLVLGGLGIVGFRFLQNRNSAADVVAGTGQGDPAEASAEPTGANGSAGGVAPTPTSASSPGGSAPGQAPTGSQSPANPRSGSSTAPAGKVPSAGQTIDAYDAEVGDCLGDPGDAPTVQTVIRLPCGQAHHSEVFAAFNLPGGSYPGDGTVEADAMEACDQRFTDFVGLHRSESVLDFSFMNPTEDSWATGDRSVTCLIYNPQASTTGSLRGSKK